MYPAKLSDVVDPTVSLARANRERLNEMQDEEWIEDKVQHQWLVSARLAPARFDRMRYAMAGESWRNLHLVPLSEPHKFSMSGPTDENDPMHRFH